MLKKFLLATVCAAGLSVAGPLSVAYADGTGTTSADAQQTVLSTQVAAVEALVTTYQNDPEGLKAAIQSLVENAADPEASSAAVLVVFDNSQNPDIKAILANNSGLAAAGGQGLGAAIATLGITQPELATRISAYVSANGGSTFTASVQSGNDVQTASIQKQQQQQQQNKNSATTQNAGGSTPEKPASAS